MNWRTASRDQRWKGGKFIGEIVFERSFLSRRGITVITHESAHAVLAWAERIGIAKALGDHQPRRRKSTFMTRDSPEERFCYALGQTCRQIVQRCYEFKIFT